MENSCWNLKVERKNHKKGQNAERVFQTLVFVKKIELLIYCFLNFLLCPFFDHNTKWKPFKVFVLFFFFFWHTCAQPNSNVL